MSQRISLLGITVKSTTGVTEPPLPLRSDPLTQMLLQTLVSPEQGVDKGKIVEAVLIPWFDIIEILKKDPSAAHQIPWDKWEEIIAGISAVRFNEGDFAR
jgi:hypothetical protein